MCMYILSLISDHTDHVLNFSSYIIKGLHYQGITQSKGENNNNNLEIFDTTTFSPKPSSACASSTIRSFI